MDSRRGTALRPVVDDLQRIFGSRLDAVVAYGWRHSGPVPSLALVRSLGLDDLNACAARASAWERAGAATPLLLTSADFARSLDAFPIEYGEILAQHDTLVGHDPFEGLSIKRDDLRRACEVQAKSLLLHVRENYIESGGRAHAVEALVRESAPGFAGLLRHLVRLNGDAAHSMSDLTEYAVRRLGLDAHVVGDLLSLADPTGPASVDAMRIFGPYLSALERLAEFVDAWREA
jgi:hypothetical protein